jgi:hypothetical protein
MKQRTTEAAVLLAAADSEFSMRELQLAELAAGEILVRIEARTGWPTRLAVVPPQARQPEKLSSKFRSHR